MEVVLLKEKSLFEKPMWIKGGVGAGPNICKNNLLVLLIFRFL